jgi:hypothetical protein
MLVGQASFPPPRNLQRAAVIGGVIVAPSVAVRVIELANTTWTGIFQRTETILT